VKNSNKNSFAKQRICKSRLYWQLTECNSSRIASRKLQFALNLVGTIFALCLKTRNNAWEVLMRVPPLLRKSRHRAKITPVRIALPIHKIGNLIQCSMVCGMQIHFFKKHSIWHELYCKKYFFAIGNSGCNGWATEVCNNRYLAPYKRIVVFPYRKYSRWLMHYPYVMYEHRSLSSLCMGLSGYRVCDRAVYLTSSVE